MGFLSAVLDVVTPAIMFTLMAALGLDLEEKDVEENEGEQEERGEEKKTEKVQKGRIETIHVRSIAELFSPKEDLEAEFGVTEEQLSTMVESYKKKQEPRERKIPVSRHFNLESYNNSKSSMRDSAINAGRIDASKRGQITNSIYKKYGKNFTKQSSQTAGDVPSLMSTPALHAEQMRLSQARRNPGHLEVRK